jgi:hypothetical protein
VATTGRKPHSVARPSRRRSTHRLCNLDFEGVRAEAGGAGGVVVATQSLEPALWNRRFTHPQLEWPASQCQHASAHPSGAVCDAHIHMGDPHFNGATIERAPLNAPSDTWPLRLSFDANLQDVDQIFMTSWDSARGEVTVTAEPSPL